MKTLTVSRLIGGIRPTGQLTDRAQQSLIDPVILGDQKLLRLGVLNPS